MEPDYLNSILGHLPGEKMSEPPAKNFWNRLSNLALVRFLLFFASGWALVQLLAYFEGVVVIFSFAAIIAFLLSYPVKWLRRFLPHGVAASFVFLLSLVMIVAFTATVGLTILSQGQQLVDKSLPDFLSYLNNLIEQLEKYLNARHLKVDFRAFEVRLQNQDIAFIGTSIGTILASSPILLDYFIKFILIEVVAFFMLLDGEKLWNFIMRFVPKPQRQKFTLIVQHNFLEFFRGQLILSLFFSFSAFVIFLVLQVPFALVLAAIAGIFQMIPGIGATLGISLICLILLPQNSWIALNVLIACIVIQQFKDNLLAPRIMQDSLNVHPVVGFFALLVGYRLAGLLGIFMAIPIAGVIISLLEIDDMKALDKSKINGSEKTG